MNTHFSSQIKRHSVAIISLIIAILALLYTAWREEVTERNRNLRVAAFEVLKNLGELQITINYIHYQPTNPMGNSFVAWGYVTLAGDLAQLLPQPVPDKVNHLIDVWKTNVSKIKEDEESLEQTSQAIDESRQAVILIIKKLR